MNPRDVLGLSAEGGDGGEWEEIGGGGGEREKGRERERSRQSL